MIAAEPFFDSNVILYLISDDRSKAQRAEDLLAEGGIVSVQVLNEIAFVALRKKRVGWKAVRELLSTVRDVCRVEPVSLAIHEHGLDIAERYGFAPFDSMIVAAAVEAGCATLFSEDMHHGQRIEGTTIKNPFVAR